MFHTDSLKCNKITPTWKYSLLWGALAFAMGLPVHAAEPVSMTHSASVKSFSIPAGALANTLREISRVSGTPIQFESFDVQDAKAPAISGTLNTIAAVQQAISNTGLTMTTLPSGAIRVYVHQLGAITVTATRSEAEKGFKATRSSTATRSGANLKETPTAITVVTAKVIETQQAQSVQDILQNVAGVITTESPQGVASYKIRGFAQTSTLSNGISNPYMSSTNVAGVDRVEVIKGPQAILSGGASLGGGVNIVTKKPTAERIRDVSVSYATHQDLSDVVDIGDAITKDKKLSYRVVGSLSRADHNDAGFNGRKADYLLTALRWKDDSTDLTFGLSYDKSAVPQNKYTIALDRIMEAPTVRLGQKNDGIKVTTKSAYYDLEQTLTSWATLVSRLQYTDTAQDLNVWNPAQGPGTTMNFANSNDVGKYKTLSGDHYIRFNFNTGPINHKLSTGINHTESTNSSIGYSGSNVSADIYGDPVNFPNIRIPKNLASLSHNENSAYGYFLQDLFSWGDFHILLGTRRTKNMDKGGLIFNPQNPPARQYRITPKATYETSSYNAGIVYDLTSNTSVYAAYSTGFLPQSTTTQLCSGGFNFPNMETKNKEVGIKGESPDGGLSWSIAGYQLDQKNVLRSRPGSQCYDVVSGSQVKGIEVETAGRVLPGWNLTFNYAYNKTKNVGQPEYLPAAQPEHQASLWSTYDFQNDDRLRGFGLSLGITAYSNSRLGYSSSSLMIPGGARVDAGVSYQHEKDWSLRLGVKNVFDRTLYGYGSSTTYVPIAEGRTATLTWKYSF
ncbi:MAG: TonB-dependent siderophore receptor [Acinetobacter sp.]